jgi:hypothetical protein
MLPVLSDDLTFTAPWGPLLKQAQAYIGNPLTPMSYAGVARRAAWGNYYYGSPYGSALPTVSEPLSTAPMPIAIADEWREMGH